MAVIAAEGVNHLPKYCLAIAGVLMGAAVLVNLIKVRAQAPIATLCTLPLSGPQFQMQHRCSTCLASKAAIVVSDIMPCQQH